MPRMSSSVTSLTFTVPTSWPFFITRRPVAQLHDVVDVMLDQEDAEALRLQLLDQFRHHLRLVRAKRGGRFVHDQDLGVEIDRAGDGDRLALAARKRVDRHVELAEVGVQPRHDLARLGLHLGFVHEAAARSRSRARGTGSRRRRGCRPARASGRSSRCSSARASRGLVDLDLLAVDQDLARVGLIGARQALDQRRFARAVVAQKAHDFAGVKIDGDVVHGLDPAERDRDVAQFDKRGSGSVYHDVSPLLDALAVDDVEPDGEDQRDADHDPLVGAVAEADQHHAGLQRRSGSARR